MGTVSLTLLALLFGQAAHAAGTPSLAIYSPNGVPAPGDVAQLVVVVHDQGVPVIDPAPQLEIDGAPLASPPVQLAPGRWSFTLPAASTSARQAHARHGRASLKRVLGKAQLPGARLRLPQTLQAEVGQLLEVRIGHLRSNPPRPEDIGVLGTDGQLVNIQPEPDGTLLARWQPSASPFPRALALGVIDLRNPQVPPEWVVAVLTGRPKIPIQTEPGAKVTIRVGGRTSKTRTAGPDGLVILRPEVRPGETSASVMTEDSLGNTQRSEIALGGDARPVLTVVPSAPIVPGRPMPHVHVHASRSGGQPWTGEAPDCSTTRQGQLRLISIGPGRWRAQLPPSIGSLAAQVRCDLEGRTQTRTPVQIETGLPTRLTLRAHPSAITADLPSAEIQAFLENAVGDRLPSREISIRAERGRLESVADTDPALVRAIYRGDRAVSAGKDVLQAGVQLSPGEGGLWSLDLQASAPQGRSTILIDGRALDQHGRPLEGTPIQLRIPGTQREAVTGPGGWASVELPWPKRANLVVAEVSAGGLVRRAAVLPGDPVQRDISGPDLSTRLTLPVLPGRISGVRLVANPRVVQTSGEEATIEVHLEDRAGKKVLNRTVQIDASIGSLSPVVRHADGRFTARYTPPPGLLSGSARINARTQDGRFAASVDLRLIPRRLKQSIGLGAGLLLNDQASSIISMEYDRRLPWKPFVFRAGASYTGQSATDAEAWASDGAQVDLQTLALSAGVLARNDGQLVPTWVGLSMVSGGHRVRSQLGQLQIGTAIQPAPPGFHTYTGAGWRMQRGELQAQLGYLFLYGSPGPISWTGQVGGVVGTLSYKLLY